MQKIDTPNTILIVDDDEINRDVLGNILAADYSIEVAETEKNVSIKSRNADNRSAPFFWT